MKINRLELIEKLKAMIAQREEDAAKALLHIREKNAAKEAAYVEETATAWSQFATTIRNRVRMGRPITFQDVPKDLQDGYRERINLFRRPVIREADYTPRTDHLTNFLAVLESCPDEFISSTALDRIGAPLRELMRP